MVARDGYPQHSTLFSIPLTDVYLDPKLDFEVDEQWLLIPPNRLFQRLCPASRWLLVMPIADGKTSNHLNLDCQI
jgi:hypothetical protein